MLSFFRVLHVNSTARSKIATEERDKSFPIYTTNSILRYQNHLSTRFLSKILLVAIFKRPGYSNVARHDI